MNIPKKEHKIGNTTIIVHSHLVAMNEAERVKWYQEEWRRGNPVLKQISEAVNSCYEVQINNKNEGFPQTTDKA